MPKSRAGVSRGEHDAASYPRYPIVPCLLLSVQPRNTLDRVAIADLNLLVGCYWEPRSSSGTS